MSELIGQIEFVNPGFLVLLLILPLHLLWQWKLKRKSESYLDYAHLSNLSGIKTWRTRLAFLPRLLRYLSLVAIIVGLARPQHVLSEEEVEADSIDIVLAMDLSGSMLAQDFNPSRLEVSKQVAQDFVTKRLHDRIGLVSFAGESFTQCPITTDHQVVKTFLSELNVGYLMDGTAIGMGLATAVNRLKDSESLSKIVILLTDGVNNAGYIKPLTAAELAQEYNIKVYTIGIGTKGVALSPYSRRSDGTYLFENTVVHIDEDLLKEISDMTGGKYYRAIDQASLESIYEEIDTLEKTKIEVNVFKRYSDKYRYFIVLALVFLGLEFLLSNTILKSLP